MYPVILAEFARRPITGARMLILRQFLPGGQERHFATTWLWTKVCFFDQLEDL
jgi:adenine-specific DNA methylase